MNKLSISFLVAAIVFALASIIIPSRSEAQSFREELACESLARFARTKVQQKIDGMELADSLRTCDYTNDRMTSYWGSNWPNLCRQITLEAYREPDYLTEEWQQRSIRNFGNDIHLICLDAMINRD